MEKDRGITIQTTDQNYEVMGEIGHVNHGLTALTAQILTDKGMSNVIVVDESNVAEIGKQIAQMKNNEPKLIVPYKNLVDIPEAKAFQVKMPRPNKGLSIGSYRYKSKRK